MERDRSRAEGPWPCRSCIDCNQGDVVQNKYSTTLCYAISGQYNRIQVTSCYLQSGKTIYSLCLLSVARLWSLNQGQCKHHSCNTAQSDWKKACRRLTTITTLPLHADLLCFMNKTLGGTVVHSTRQTLRPCWSKRCRAILSYMAETPVSSSQKSTMPLSSNSSIAVPCSSSSISCCLHCEINLWHINNYSHYHARDLYTEAQPLWRTVQNYQWPTPVTSTVQILRRPIWNEERWRAEGLWPDHTLPGIKETQLPSSVAFRLSTVLLRTKTASCL